MNRQTWPDKTNSIFKNIFLQRKQQTSQAKKNACDEKNHKNRSDGGTGFQPEHQKGKFTCFWNRKQGFKIMNNGKALS